MLRPRPRIRPVIVIAVVMLAGACSDAEPNARPAASPRVSPRTSTSPPTSPTPSAPGGGASGGCENEAAALADEAPARRSLEGDLDGDGSPDEVSLVVDEAAPVGCRVFLVAEAASGRIATAIDRPEITFGLGLPTILAIQQVDGVGGGDVIVDLLTGASTAFASVFVWSGDGFDALTVPDADPGLADLFAHGGSVGHLSAVDCGSGDTLVVASAIPQGKLYVVQRRVYDIVGGELTLDERAGGDSAVTLKRLPKRFPEFAGVPFASCAP